MKIAFTGASGSGKTTLATWLAEEMKLKFLVGSSGTLKHEVDREYLKKQHGFLGGKGHANVIMESHKNPNLGKDIQEIVRKRRADILKANDNFVTDRSPIDNWVYYILQVGPYLSQEECDEFLSRVMPMVEELDFIIYVPSMFDQIENNQSRVANKYYQQAVDSYFAKTFYTFKRAFNSTSTKFLSIDMLDLELRKQFLMNMVVMPSISGKNY